MELVPNPVAHAYQYFTCADMTALDSVLTDRPATSVAFVEARATELFEAFLRNAHG
ncbi:hypothetical protein ACIPW5_36535 [Streptomyces sp. NPDC090077]|uniref:hypothetical protein n=1 Tax=Streptomyces sp. NPDC090077 TaxID=3365938 RepID=UPI0038014D2E